MPPVVYLCHQIGELDGNGGQIRGENFMGAGEWMRYLADTTRWHLCAPWWPLVVALRDHDSMKYGGRVNVDTQAIQERCDVLTLIGGALSQHMKDQIKKAKRIGQPIVDLTSFGILPPAADDEDAALQISQLVKLTMAARLRRVWMPLMTQGEFEILKRARHALYTHLPDGYDDEVASLDRIIAAIAATKPA